MFWLSGLGDRCFFSLLVGRKKLVELAEFGLEKCFVGEGDPILRHHGGREGSAKGVFDDFGVLAGAEENPDGRIFVRFAHVTVQGFEIEIDFTEILGLEAAGLEFDGDKAVQGTMKEEQIESKILTADLDGKLRTDKTEVASEFGEEAPKVAQEGGMKVRLGMRSWEAEKLKEVGIPEGRLRLRMQFSQHW